MVFPVVVYGCESWTVKKDQLQRIDAFELWCWRWLLWVPWTARRSNQSILKEISPEYSLEGLMLKLKLQYSGHLIRRTEWLEKTLMLGNIEGGRRWEQQRMNGWMALPMFMSLRKLQELVMDREAWPAVSMGLQRVGHDWVTELNYIQIIQAKLNLKLNFSWWWLYLFAHIKIARDLGTTEYPSAKEGSRMSISHLKEKIQYILLHI